MTVVTEEEESEECSKVKTNEVKDRSRSTSDELMILKRDLVVALQSVETKEAEAEQLRTKVAMKDAEMKKLMEAEPNYVEASRIRINELEAQNEELKREKEELRKNSEEKESRSTNVLKNGRPRATCLWQLPQ